MAKTALTVDTPDLPSRITRKPFAGSRPGPRKIFIKYRDQGCRLDIRMPSLDVSLTNTWWPGATLHVAAPTSHCVCSTSRVWTRRWLATTKRCARKILQEVRGLVRLTPATTTLASQPGVIASWQMGSGFEEEAKAFCNGGSEIYS